MWEGPVILVGATDAHDYHVRVRPPYSPDACVGGGNPGTLARVRKVVEHERARLGLGGEA